MATLVIHLDNFLKRNKQNCCIYGAINRCDKPCNFMKLKKKVKMFQINRIKFVGPYKHIQYWGILFKLFVNLTPDSI